MSVVEQRYQAVLAVIDRGETVTSVAGRFGVSATLEVVVWSGSALWDESGLAQRVPPHLRAQMTPLIGRSSEIADLAKMLSCERLVTLTGSGGVGKTRLAIEVASTLRDNFSGGVHMVELAPIANPIAIPPALLAAIGASEDSMRPAIEVVIDRLGQLPSLVLIDNCEHVVEAAADLIGRLLSTCPQLHILATSREALRVPGEINVRVPSLSVPPPLSTVHPHEDISTFAAVQLFLDRAQRARPDLLITAPRLEAVASICLQLDGIPLAIELAAARCSDHLPERIAVELDEGLRVLTRGARTAPARQQSLRASVQWSYDLLEASEQKALQRVCVVAGAFGQDLAVAVLDLGDLGDAWRRRELLDSLVAKSLLQLDVEGEYRMLETVRQFALERLETSGEQSLIRDAHANWWTTELVRLDARHASTETMMLCADHAADLRGALDWLEPRRDRRHELLALVALSWFWEGRSDDVLYYAERWLLRGPEGDRDLAWARAFASAAPVLFANQAMPAYEWSHAALVPLREAGDAQGLILLMLVVPASIRTTELLVEVLEAAIDHGLERLLCAFGEFYLEDGIVPERPDLAAGFRDSIDAARRRDAGPFPLLWTRTEDPSEQYARLSWIAETTSRHRDRCVLLVGIAIVQGSLQGLLAGMDEPFSPARRFLSRYAATPVIGLWSAMTDGLAAVLAGRAPTELELTGIEYGVSEASVVTRYPIARALIALGEPERADSNMMGFDRPGLAQLMGAALAGARLLHEERVPEAAEVLLEGLVPDAHFVRYPGVDLLELLAVVSRHTGDSTRSARLLGAAERLRSETGYRFRFADLSDWVAEATSWGQAALGPSAWHAALEDGRSLDHRSAYAYAARRRGRRGRPSFGWESLTPTERLVVGLAADGLTNPEIAARLLVATATAKTHLSSAMRKVGASNRTDLALRAQRRRVD